MLLNINIEQDNAFTEYINVTLNINIDNMFLYVKMLDECDP